MKQERPAEDHVGPVPAEPRLEEIPGREPDRAAALAHAEARPADDVLDVEDPIGHAEELKQAAVGGGERRHHPTLVGGQSPCPSPAPAPPAAVPPAKRPLQHVPLEERRHPPLEQLAVVVEDLAGAVEVLLARAHRLQLVLTLAVALGAGDR